MVKDSTRVWVRRATLAALALGTLLVAGVGLDSYLDPFDDRPFDASEWAAADEQHRGPMARDAVRHLPAGLPASRVRELLGEPEGGSAATDRRMWSYWLGCWSGLGPYGFDTASLDVYFDPDGRVVRAEITGG